MTAIFIQNLPNLSTLRFDFSLQAVAVSSRQNKSPPSLNPYQPAKVQIKGLSLERFRERIRVLPLGSHVQ